MMAETSPLDVQPFLANTTSQSQAPSSMESPLANGHMLPLVAFGTWTLTEDQAYHAVTTALEVRDIFLCFKFFLKIKSFTPPFGIR